jgi:hypothetical protein
MPLPIYPNPPKLAGWGEAFGATSWGDDTINAVALVAAEPVAENVVRLVFNVAPMFSFLQDLHDGSRRARYAVDPVGGTFGADDRPTRAVIVREVRQRTDLDVTGRTVDIVLDRPFSPFPSQYVVTANNLVAALDGSPMDVTHASIGFYGLQRVTIAPDPERVVPSRDFANPQTLAQLLDATGNADPTGLGTHPVDQTGDYATDEGIQNLKKRVFRRLITAKGAFLHAKGYGVGVAAEAKKLNSPGTRDLLASEAERQIGLEPDVRKVKVKVILDPSNPGMVRFLILIKTIQGIGVKFEAPFSYL